MATALSVMEVIEKEKLQDNAEEVGEYCKSLLEKLKDKHQIIGDVRWEDTTYIKLKSTGPIKSLPWIG